MQFLVLNLRGQCFNCSLASYGLGIQYECLKLELAQSLHGFVLLKNHIYLQRCQCEKQSNCACSYKKYLQSLYVCIWSNQIVNIIHNNMYLTHLAVKKQVHKSSVLSGLMNIIEVTRALNSNSVQMYSLSGIL